MLVLLLPQGFADTPTRKYHKFYTVRYRKYFVRLKCRTLKNSDFFIFGHFLCQKLKSSNFFASIVLVRRIITVS